MRLTRLILPALLLAGVSAPAAAQLRASRPARPVQNLPRLFVANPYVHSSADSTAAVRVGDGIRKKMDNVAGRWYNVITREQMNEALLQYAYPADAVLAPMVARTLANTLQARVMVGGTMTKGDNNRFSAAIRVVGMNDKAGHLITMSQGPNQSLEEFGEQLANATKDAFNALPDAKECWDNQVARPDRAISAARKALQTQPNHGLAEYCLGEIHIAQKAPPESVITHFRNATRGDSLSLDAWSQLAIQYQTNAADSNATIETFKQMLRIAPTNQALREQAFKLFLAYDRAGEALNVANEGIDQDPTNPDMYDLKSNACLFNSDFPCAVEALEQVYALDPEKADSGFFLKISVAASQQPDTARLLKWASLGVTKYPANASLLDFLVKAYSYAGPVDSLVAVTRRYLAVDSSDVTPALVATQSLIGAKRYAEAYSLGDLAMRLGDDNARNQYAGILIQTVQALFQTQPIDFVNGAEMSRRALAASTNPQITNAAQFYLGVSAFQLAIAKDSEIVEAKSCEMIPQLEALVREASTAITAGQSVSPEYAQPVISAIEQYQGPRGRIQTVLRRAFCR